jgi:single-strand DNA-binding protein
MPQVITAVGNLVKDPEVKTFEKGALTKLRIACTDRMSDGNGGWKDGDTNFYDVAVWKSLGEYAASTLKKGDKVIVQGKLKYREFKKNDGSNGHAYEIDATDLGVYLTKKTANPSGATVSIPAGAATVWG